jgi:hypothetical protein
MIILTHSVTSQSTFARFYFQSRLYLLRSLWVVLLSALMFSPLKKKKNIFHAFVDEKLRRYGMIDTQPAFLFY